MQLRIDHAQPDDAPIIAQMVGELLREIMAAMELRLLVFTSRRRKHGPDPG
jgi:hypothetical protein